jgi:hypothetical protein
MLSPGYGGVPSAFQQRGAVDPEAAQVKNVLGFSRVSAELKAGLDPEQNVLTRLDTLTDLACGNFNAELPTAAKEGDLIMGPLENIALNRGPLPSGTCLFSDLIKKMSFHTTVHEFPIEIAGYTQFIQVLSFRNFFGRDRLP